MHLFLSLSKMAQNDLATAIMVTNLAHKSYLYADMKSGNETKAWSYLLLYLSKPRLIYLLELFYYIAGTGELSISLI